MITYTNTLTGSAKSPAVDLLSLNTLRDPKSAFLSLKAWAPLHSYMGSPQQVSTIVWDSIFLFNDQKIG